MYSIPEYTCILCKSRFVNKILSFILNNFSFKLYKSHALSLDVPFISDSSALVVYLPHMHRVIALNSGVVFFYAATILFYIIQRIISPEFYVFPIASGASINPTSQVYSSAMLVLPII